MKKKLTQTAKNYGVAFVAFITPLIITATLRRFSINSDLAIIYVGAIMAAAWFGGTAPGVLVAILFEIIVISLGPKGATITRFIIAEVNRTILLVLLPILVGARRKAERNLRHQSEWLEVTLSSIGEAVIATDIIGTVGFMNPLAEGYTGWKMVEAAGKPLDEVFKIARKGEYPLLEDDPATIMPETGAGAIQEDVILTSRSGARRNIYYNRSPIRNRRSEITGSVLVFRDVTEHEQLREQFRQAQKMEAIGRLAGGVAHDFNNLLTAIIGYSDLLMRDVGVDANLRPKVEEIGEAGRRAAVLTSQLLAFSRKQILQPRVLDLNVVVKGIEKMLVRLIGEDIDICTITRTSLGMVKADPGQIEQILMNLAVNARDAMPDGGKLTIETANVELDEAYSQTHAEVTPGRYVMLAVSDTGHGMDAETQARMFEPFFTTKEKGKGTGLGLSTVFGIVKQSGGHIWVYSEPGHGVVFKIYFPRVIDVVVEETETETVSVESLNGSETIMLVEDDESVRELTRSVLEMYGYSVLGADHGAKALEAFGPLATAIDLVITDVIMPQMNGAELVAKLKELHPQVKVLYVSGYTEEATIHRGVIDKGVNFLQKPFTPDTLAVKVREVLDYKFSEHSNGSE